jgi:hypothetical protein
MKRRNLLLGLGAAVSGGAATMGTGAFSSAQANRSVSVTVEGDNPSAYLALDETDDSDGTFTDLPNGGAGDVTSTGSSGDELIIDLNGFPGTASGSSGPATNATTDVDGVFEIINQSTQDLFVNIESLSFDSNDDGTDDTFLRFYPGEDSGADLSSGTDELRINTGNSAPIGIQIETNENAVAAGGSSTPDADTTITATATSDNSSTINDGDYTDPQP